MTAILLYKVKYLKNIILQ